ncbi:hypothetical protein Poli38472_008941 [Pythium oligandrum]|uniref:DUF7802 domain-containing protein n=1 Tax=Pythium oligandrum TaxID=41045 RepID=A0A8K1FEY8_PYTOL|nr:hypothetical protein Poli38472_008941 [Pythium oligandrum]|eukprot:TMW56293.1 hypothetical protein Poli38472_008941 [Pythium oligandrum]
MVPSRVVSIAFFGLVQENVSLLSIEIVCYLTTFLLMLHIHSSGKRNATMLAAAFVQLVIMELLFFGQKRWHAQSLIMLIPERLPLFTVLIQAHFYYMAFVATSRLRIDSFIQPLAMGCLVLLFIFPFEILGAKFLWWTWHDTDPILVDRALGVPYHIFFNHFFFAVAFLTGHHLVRWTVLEGEYYEDDNWKREWSYVMFVPFITNLFGVVLLILFYHLFVELLHVQTAASFGLLLLMSLTFCWMADRERDDPYLQNILAPVDAYDSDWLYPFIDHAVNQMVFVYSLIEIVLIGLIDPSTIVSVGHHQPLGDCDENETFRTILGMRHNRKRYLCVHEYDEEFNLCNYPVAQLNYEESWYMICGRGYADYATYLAVILGFIFFTNLLFYQILKRPHRTRIVSFQRKHL